MNTLLQEAGVCKEEAGCRRRGSQSHCRQSQAPAASSPAASSGHHPGRSAMESSTAGGSMPRLRSVGESFPVRTRMAPRPARWAPSASPRMSSPTITAQTRFPRPGSQHGKAESSGSVAAGTNGATSPRQCLPSHSAAATAGVSSWAAWILMPKRRSFSTMAWRGRKVVLVTKRWGNRRRWIHCRASRAPGTALVPT